MSGSYYYSHYRHDRGRLTDEQMALRYFEHRHRYELAFIAAFKALESVLRTTQIQDNRVEHLLTDLQDGRATADSPYERFHETFRGKPKQSTFGEMVRHFLKLRNVVAAHSNPRAPSEFKLSEDSIFELQAFIRTLCSALTSDWAPARLPRRAFIDLSTLGAQS